MVTEVWFGFVFPSFCFLPFLLIQLKQTSVQQPGLWKEALFSVRATHTVEKAEMFEHISSSFVLHLAVL